MHVVRQSIQKMSDDQIRELIVALVGGLVHGMVGDVAARADEIVDTVVDSIIDQLTEAADRAQSKDGQTVRVQDSVKHTCEICGRVGSRRFVPTATGWKCAPTATACKGNQQPEPPAPALEHGHAATYDLGCRCGPCKVANAELKVAAARTGPKPADDKTPAVTARCQDCPRAWTITGDHLRVAIEHHEQTYSHIVDYAEVPA
ncbi:hypothetical protein AWB94_04820 [Mycolicibacterium canariasense]|nr:hypothetical protein AWB94_04820 [Mycolicibacterium canariasense]